MNDRTPLSGGIEIPTVKTGDITIVPPTFLEKWGVVLVACTGGWILLVASVLLAYFLWKAPTLPLASQSPEQLKDAANSYRVISEQWRDSLTYIFDLLVTKTTLPIVTLLLGYLFGRSKGLA